MILKKVFWFGTVSLKVFRGLEPGRGRVVDARTITPSILNQFGHHLVISDKDGCDVEFAGKSVSQARAKSLFPSLDFSTISKPAVLEPELRLPEEPLEEFAAPEIEQLALTSAEQLAVSEEIQPELVVSEQNPEEKVKSKKGRKPKVDSIKELENDGTTDLTVE
jgi:hypothetical protein